MQNCFGLLDTDVMPIFIIIALDIVITLRFSINCSIVICLPTVCFLSREKPLVKSIAPGLFSIIYFQIYKPKNPKIPFCNLFPFVLFYVLVIFYIYLYQISSLQVTVKGLTTPLSRWLQVFDCLCRCIDWRLVCTSYWIDTLVLKLREILISTLLHQPFLFKGKTNASSRSSRKNFWHRCRGDLRQVKTYQVPIINSHLLHYIIRHLPLVFLSPTSKMIF